MSAYTRINFVKNSNVLKKKMKKAERKITLVRNRNFLIFLQNTCTSQKCKAVHLT